MPQTQGFIQLPSFIKQILLDLKPQIDPNTVIIGRFNTTHIDRSYRKTLVKCYHKSNEPRRECSIQTLKNVHPSRHPTELSTKLTTYWDTQ